MSKGKYTRALAATDVKSWATDLTRIWHASWPRCGPAQACLFCQALLNDWTATSSKLLSHSSVLYPIYPDSKSETGFRGVSFRDTVEYHASQRRCLQLPQVNWADPAECAVDARYDFTQLLLLQGDCATKPIHMLERTALRALKNKASSYKLNLRVPAAQRVCMSVELMYVCGLSRTPFPFSRYFLAFVNANALTKTCRVNRFSITTRHHNLFVLKEVAHSHDS